MSFRDQWLTFVSVAWLSVVPGITEAQTQAVLNLDLATQKPGETITKPLPTAQGYEVVISNRIPTESYRYDLSITVKEHVVAALTLPSASANALKVAVSIPECEAVKHAIDGLTKADTEPKVRDIVAGIPKPLSPACLLMLAPSLALTERHDTLGMISHNSDVTITVTKSWESGGKQQKAEWILEYQGAPRGAWRTSYGFAFVADLLSRNRTFHAEPMDSTGNFTIEEDSRGSRVRFVPSVIFLLAACWQQ